MDEVTGLTKNERGDFVRGPARQNKENFIKTVLVEAGTRGLRSLSL